jgi:hypothetical protein
MHLVDVTPAYSEALLFEKLYVTPFIAYMDLDTNRIGDVYTLRDIFAMEFGMDISSFERNKPSILEVMISLARRGEMHIMSNSEYGDRTGLWFKEMLCSLGLMDYIEDSNYDDNAVNDIISKFLHRKYESNGSGGLFTVSKPPKDMRTTDLYQQMGFWFDEVLEKEGYFR